MPTHSFIGEIARHAGVTATTTVGITQSLFARKGNNDLWTQGAIGISVTSIVAGTTWGVAVWGRLNGTSFKIAELANIHGVSALVMPFCNETNQLVLGSTQSSMFGSFLTPKTMVVSAVSAGIGITFGCVVSASLRSV